MEKWRFVGNRRENRREKSPHEVFVTSKGGVRVKITCTLKPFPYICIRKKRLIIIFYK